MTSLFAVLSSIFVTFLCWGTYGPILHEGQHHMGGSSLLPLICVGLAYFVIAVVAPFLMLRTRGEKGQWTINGTVWSLAAGAAGAVGALGIILAFKFGGSPVYVMPLVFGTAPVVNTIVTMAMTRTFKEAGILFFAGVVAVALGGAGVMFFRPQAKNVEIEELSDGAIHVHLEKIGGSTETWKAKNLKDLETNPELETAYGLYLKKQGPGFLNFLLVLLSIGVTGLCWGCYGPVLHKGQMKMNGSRLRPLMCVGAAYFAIAVIVPFALLPVVTDPGGWSFWGAVWSLGAGAAGAIGALGIIYAFNFGGKPILVMPLVFGMAPVVNTFTMVTLERTITHVSVMFFASLALVVAGAATVLIFGPKPKKPEAKSKEEKSGLSKS